MNLTVNYNFMKVSVNDLSSQLSSFSMRCGKEWLLLVSVIEANKEEGLKYYWQELEGFQEIEKEMFRKEYGRLVNKNERFGKGKQIDLNVKSEVEEYKWLYSVDGTGIAFIFLYEESISSNLLNKLLRRMRCKISQRKFIQGSSKGRSLKRDFNSLVKDFNRLLRKQNMSDFLSSSKLENSGIIVFDQNQSDCNLIEIEPVEEVKEVEEVKTKKLFKDGTVKNTFVLAFGITLMLLLFKKFLVKVL